MIKKILKITIILFLVLLGAAFAAPFIFKGKIMAIAKNEINKKLNAKVDFKDIDLSFFRHFPKVAVAVSGLQVTGVGEFEGDTLVSAKNIDAAIYLMSVIKGSDFTIYSFNIDEPRIHAIVHKNGSANWSITKPDTSTASGQTSTAKLYKLNLQSYSIKNGFIKYDNQAGNMSSEITNLNHEGSGDFTADNFTLKTKTAADAVSFNYGGIPYLTKTKTNIDADIDIDNKSNKYSFKTDKVQVNDLKLNTAGFFQLVNDSEYNMNISYNAPSIEFKDILSLIPVIYQKDFASVKTSGQAVFNGFVKGTYSNTQIPAYNLNLDIKNGFFQYPDLPKPVKNILLSVKVDNPDGITDHTIVNIPNGHIEIDNEPFDFRLLLKNPVSDMFIDAAAKGKLDLSKVAQLVKLENGTRLSGLLNADVSVKGAVSAIQKKEYENFNAAGTVNLDNFFYASKDYPSGVKLNTILASFNPKNVTLSNLAGQYMGTNFTADAVIDNLLPYVLKNKSLSGVVNVKADKMNLDDWMGTSAAPASTTSTATASGKAPVSSAPFAVPANLDLKVNAGVNTVHYDKLDLNNLVGSLVLKDETVSLNNVKSNALDGTIEMNGSYSTKESKKKPDITLTYDVTGLDVEKTFTAFNTVQKLMPIGQFISGKLSSHLTMKGKLGENMMPDLGSLTGNGNLLLIEGFLKKFAPLEKLASTLNVSGLESISIKDIKNYIEFANGKVMVKPFTVKVKDIAMEIGGMHGFDQSIDYIINMKVPRALMGDKGNAFVNSLVSQVNSKGVPVKVGDVVNLKVHMGGTISNPSIQTDLKQAGSSLADDLKKQAVVFARAKIDSSKTAVTSAVKDTVASLKKQALKSAGDELKKQLLGNKDTTQQKGTEDNKKKAIESAKGLIDNLNPFKKKKSAADTSKQQ